MGEFIVSARKYRPATFLSVVGQQSITSTLKNAIERGQLAHAYLFCGPRGVGKTTCARIFAKAINCQNPNGAEACNECESCKAFNEGRSLNIHELDAASNNSVDDIRSLIEQVRILPQVGSYSLFIIDEVHMLSQQAFNAFLKTLEEPPKHAIFILATTEKHKIIPTILSRCQVYDFNRIKVEDSVGYLKHIAQSEGVEYDEESLNLIAQKADGGMRDALSMFDKAVSFCDGKLQYKEVAQTLNMLDYDTYFTMTELLLAGDYVKALLRFDEILSKGFSGQTFMAGLNQHFRDLLLAKGPAISLIELTGALLERYRKQAEQCETEFLFGAISLLTEADGKIKQSSNQRLLVELGLMKIAGLGKKKSDDDTLESEYQLPTLPDKITPVGAESVVPVAVQQQSSEPQSVVAEVKPKSEPEFKPEPVVEENVVQGVSQSKSIEQPTEVTQIAGQSEQSRSTTVRRSTLSQFSIRSLMNEVEQEQPTEKTQRRVAVDADKMSEEKLTEARERIIADILEWRPRFVEFHEMTIAGNVISVKVGSQTLYEEIMRNRTELLSLVMRSAGAKGAVELNVIVDEKIQAARPIKLEDRRAFLAEKNPKLLDLKAALELEFE
ncbi:MAG: DNA polymerase III subunit gamma/tau [Alistipes sp.]|nr:DNA polymerase III subunit gamma/tau [Alistipes sp.]